MEDVSSKALLVRMLGDRTNRELLEGVVEVVDVTDDGGARR